jgi:predicted CoA-binding protein
MIEEQHEGLLEVRIMIAKSSKAAVEDFISQEKLAVVGVSRNPKKFGNMAYRELKAKGYELFAVNPNLEKFEGDSCYPNLNALPQKVDGVLIVVPPSETERVVREAEGSGIKRVWMQQGAESETAIKFCQEHGLAEVHGECILMFAAPVKSYHKLHRGLVRLLGKLPK